MMLFICIVICDNRGAMIVLLVVDGRRAENRLPQDCTEILSPLITYFRGGVHHRPVGLDKKRYGTTCPFYYREQP